MYEFSPSDVCEFFENRSILQKSAFHNSTPHDIIILETSDYGMKFAPPSEGNHGSVFSLLKNEKAEPTSDPAFPFNECMRRYFMDFLLNPNAPMRPKPRRRMVLGSGTAANASNAASV